MVFPVIPCVICEVCWPIWVGLVLVYGFIWVLALFKIKWAVKHRDNMKLYIKAGWDRMKRLRRKK